VGDKPTGTRLNRRHSEARMSGWPLWATRSCVLMLTGRRRGSSEGPSLVGPAVAGP
jgi:hypothetical protein